MIERAIEIEHAIEAGEPIFRRLEVSDLEIKSIDERTRTIWHVITREVSDRMGDIVRIDGLGMSEFERKPAVLYGHDYRSMNPIPVIARNVGFERVGDKLYAGTQFLPVDDPKMSQGMKDLINDNWILHTQKLLGWSIGFMPKEVDKIMDGDTLQGYDFKKSNLLEYSSVVIPAHQDALTEMLRKGVLSESFLNTLPEDLKSKTVGMVEMRIPAATITDYVSIGKVFIGEPVEPEKNEPQQAEEAKAEAPAAESEPIDPNENQDGGNTTMKLETILAKIEKGEELTSEEKELMAKVGAAFPKAEQKEAPAPVRKLDLTDGRVSDVRHVSKFYGDENSGLVPDDPRTYTPAEKELVDFLDKSYLASVALGKRPDQLKMWSGFFNRNSSLRKAMAEATSGSGSEWVPTLLSADTYRMFYLQSPVATLFPDIPMPSNPYTPPYSFDNDDGYYYVSESVSDEPSKSPTSVVTSGLITLTARKFKRRILFSDELTEDSIVPVLSTLRDQVISAGSRAIENAIINGDVTATHQDSDTTDPKDIRKIWPGLRKLCPAGTKVDLGTFATATLATIRTAMSKWGMDPSQVAWIPGPKSYNKCLALTEVLTVDKFGPAAVIHSGQLASLLGIPIIPSEKIRENLNASGVYDGTTTTKTIMLIVNKNGFILGSRGTAKVKLESEGATDQNQLTVSFRKAFQYIYIPSTYPTIGLAYNIA